MHSDVKNSLMQKCLPLALNATFLPIADFTWQLNADHCWYYWWACLVMCLESKRLQSTTALGVGTKPGLWTLDWTVDWIMDSILDLIVFQFGHLKKSILHSPVHVLVQSLESRFCTYPCPWSYTSWSPHTPGNPNINMSALDPAD